MLEATTVVSGQECNENITNVTNVIENQRAAERGGYFFVDPRTANAPRKLRQISPGVM